jgi:hypothetical protein
MSVARTWIGELLSERQVVPRWRSPNAAAERGDRTDFLVNRNPLQKKQRWLSVSSNDVSLSNDAHAKVELDEIAFMVTGRPHEWDVVPDEVLRLRNTWERISATQNSWPPPSMHAGEHGWLEREQQKVREVRAALRLRPAQPLLWAELARAHLILGHGEKSKEEMSCALQLATRSSYLRRAAARMYLNLELPDVALRTIRKHPGMRGDPRMLAAEIAVSEVARKPSKAIDSASKLVFDPNYSISAISELAAALATVELENGKHKRAKLLFQRAMLEPSENSVAQAQWATQFDNRIIIPDHAWSVPFSYEANALVARSRNDWDDVLLWSERWLADEPYSVRPALVGSFSCFTPEQVVKSASIASTGLENHPHNVTLLNNRAVSRCYMGDLSGAGEDLKNALRIGNSTDAYLTATVGLLAYRHGNREMGATYYSRALGRFANDKAQRATMALAALFWLREEAPYADESLRGFLQKFSGILTRSGLAQEPEIRSMLDVVKAEFANPPLMLPGISSTYNDLTLPEYQTAANEHMMLEEFINSLE